MGYLTIAAHHVIYWIRSHDMKHINWVIRGWMEFELDVMRNRMRVDVAWQWRVHWTYLFMHFIEDLLHSPIHIWLMVRPLKYSFFFLAVSEPHPRKLIRKWWYAAMFWNRHYKFKKSYLDDTCAVEVLQDNHLVFCVPCSVCSIKLHQDIRPLTL